MEAYDALSEDLGIVRFYWTGETRWHWRHYILECYLVERRKTSETTELGIIVWSQ